MPPKGRLTIIERGTLITEGSLGMTKLKEVKESCDNTPDETM